MSNQNFNLPQFTIRQLLEAGVHFGHKTMRRNPKMSKYIYGVRNGLSIIDLGQTATLLRDQNIIVQRQREVRRCQTRFQTNPQEAHTFLDATSPCLLPFP